MHSEYVKEKIYFPTYSPDQVHSIGTIICIYNPVTAGYPFYESFCQILDASFSHIFSKIQYKKYFVSLIFCTKQKIWNG